MLRLNENLWRELGGGTKHFIEVIDDMCTNGTMKIYHGRIPHPDTVVRRQPSVTANSFETIKLSTKMYRYSGKLNKDARPTFFRITSGRFVIQGTCGFKGQGTELTLSSNMYNGQTVSIDFTTNVCEMFA